MQVIYIDLLFLLNFLMDFVVLYCTSMFLKQTKILLRITAASGILALYSSIMFFPQLSFAYTLIAKTIILSLSVWIAFPSPSLARFAKNILTFFAVNGVFGGIMFALIFATDFGTHVGAAVSNGEIYLNISASSILLSIIPAYLVAFALSHIRQQTIKSTAHIADLEVFFKQKKVKAKAYCDTGCNLYEPLTGKPAVIIDKKLACELFGKRLYNILTFGSISDAAHFDEHIYILAYSTVDHDCGVMLGVAPTAAFLNNTPIPSCVIAVTPHRLCRNNLFNAIINPDIIEKNQNSQILTERTEHCAKQS